MVWIDPEISSVGSSLVLLMPRLWIKSHYAPLTLELDLKVLMGSLQLRIFCDSVNNVCNHCYFHHLISPCVAVLTYYSRKGCSCAALFVGVCHKDLETCSGIYQVLKKVNSWLKIAFHFIFPCQERLTSHRHCNSPWALQGCQFYWKFNLFTTIEGHLSCHPQQHSTNPAPKVWFIDYYQMNFHS